MQGCSAGFNVARIKKTRAPQVSVCCSGNCTLIKFLTNLDFISCMFFYIFFFCRD